MATTHQDLEAWKQGVTLAAICKTATAGFSAEDRFLADDMLGKAVSIPAGIARGFEDGDPSAMAAAIDEARGGLGAAETCIIAAERVGLLARAPSRQLLDQCDRVGKALRDLSRASARSARRP